ncbi:hypothetical protein HY641_03365 [Candidatus Woesearchaeota archaeon]|nr:hypothetical protein [Candidatus Woesearchaeota archaeon]
METVTIPKTKFGRILDDVETLIHDVECAMSEEEKVVQERIADIEEGRVEGKTEEEYYAYLKRRGIAIDAMAH